MSCKLRVLLLREIKAWRDAYMNSTIRAHVSGTSQRLTWSEHSQQKCLSSTPLCHGAPQSWPTTPHTLGISALSQSSVSKSVPLTTASSPSLAIDIHSTILWMVASVSRYVLRPLLYLLVLVCQALMYPCPAAFLVVADEGYGRQVPFAFLEKVREEFQQKFADKGRTSPAHSLDKVFG